MEILNYAYYNFLRYIRDIKSLSMMLLLPIVLIFILGNALNSSFELKPISKTKVAYLNQDKGSQGKVFDQVINSKEIQKMLSIKKVSSESEGIKHVKDKKESAFINIKDNFSTKVLSHKNAEIEVYGGSEKMRNAIVKIITDRYANDANAYITVMEMGVTNPQITYGNKSNISEEPIPGTGRVPKAIDYYAVTMLILILLYGSAYAIYGVGEDFLEAMGGRLKSAPVKIYKQFIGKMLGIVVLLVLQSLVLILFTKYVYGANWGSDVIGVLSIVVTMSMFITSLGGMLCLLLKNKMAANGLINVLIPVFTFIAGGYAYFPSNNGWFDTVRHLLPNSLAQNALFSVIYKSPFVKQEVLSGVLTQFQLSMVLMWGMIAVILIITALSGRRRLA